MRRALIAAACLLATATVLAPANAITSSSMWQTGNNAIVVTFDEGNVATNRVVTVVITSHGPPGREGQHVLQSLLAAGQPAADIRPGLPAEQLHGEGDDAAVPDHRVR
jgi:hypothetical protein